ncbi:MAG: hypothetical protein ABEK17_00190 [Candidatus Aenigmatarchaeota archaeon]
MKHSIKTGLSFGLTSAVITTLGLMVGLNSGTHSRTVVLGGILTIAIADALSDSLGIHISEESEGKHTHKQIWTSTLTTFLTKFSISMSFILPVLFLSLTDAVFTSLIWGFSLLILFSYYIGRGEKIETWKVILEHVSIGLIVVLITHYTGMWISSVLV